MKQDTKIIKRTYADGGITYIVHIHRKDRYGNQTETYVGGFDRPTEFMDLEEATKAAKSNAFTETEE